MKRKVISISIDANLIEGLDEVSRRCNMSKSRFIENLLIKVLDVPEVKGDNDNEES